MSTYRKIAVLMPLVLALLPAGASGQDVLGGWNPSVTEATLLPKFCWGQFLGNKFKGPEFEIPRDTCGVGMNHYCPGLVALGRANRSFDNKTKRGFLEGAERGVRYTVRAMEKYPRCPIRADVTRTYQLIERELSLSK